MSNANDSLWTARGQTPFQKQPRTVLDALVEWVLDAIEQSRRERIAQARRDHSELTAHLSDEDVLRWLKLDR